MENSQKKQHYYYQHIGDFKRELRDAIPHDVVQELHQCSAVRHFIVTARQITGATLCIAVILLSDRWFYWLPCSIALGFIIFDCTILLHEVIHNLVLPKKNKALDRLLGWLYTLPSGISQTQFKRWHLDHHAKLGSSCDDPKRAHLTPKINKRWYKLLYATPFLFYKYFNAAAQEVRGYPEKLRATIKIERLITISIHFVIMAGIGWLGGGWILLKVYLIPYFFVFPVAFTLNRLGQHYNINPDDVAQWSTLMQGSFLWDFVFLNSNYHLEHHYFPGIPLYNLPRVHHLLEPLYKRHGMKKQTYTKLLSGWFIENRAPHTNWDAPEQAKIDSL